MLEDQALALVQPRKCSDTTAFPSPCWEFLWWMYTRFSNAFNVSDNWTVYILLILIRGACVCLLVWIVYGCKYSAHVEARTWNEGFIASKESSHGIAHLPFCFLAHKVLGTACFCLQVLGLQVVASISGFLGTCWEYKLLSLVTEQALLRTELFP